MDKEYERKYHINEEKNWWFVARRAALVQILSKHDKNAKILDIGCAGGPLLLDLQKAGFTNVHGLDFSKDAITMCKQRGLKNVYVMDGHNPNFEENSFDVIVSSDSLEHLERDTVALSNWKKILKQNGKFLVFVPAYLFLWSEHDVANHHYRRYSKKLLKSVVSGAGFQIKRSSFWNCALFFPISIFRLNQTLFKSKNKQHKPKDQLQNFNPILNNFLVFWLKIENAIFTKVGLPIGVSVFVEATKQ